MTLHVYFGRRFAQMLLIVVGAFALILTMFELVEQVRRYEVSQIGIAGALGLSVLTMPQGLYSALPVAAVLAAIAYFLALARTAEMTAARAAGQSAARSLLAPVVTAALAGGLAVIVLNPLAAAMTQRHAAATARLAGAEPALALGREGLWLRQGAQDGGQIVIRAVRAEAAGTILGDVSLIAFSAAGAPRWRIEAEQARLEPGAWRITGAKRWRLDADNPEAAAERLAETTVPSTLTPERIRDSFRAPGAIGIWNLPQFIADIEAAGFSSRGHRVWLQMQIALPALFAAMVMLAAGFTMTPARSGHVAQRVLAAFGLGIAFFFLRNFARVLGESGQLPVLLAAWAPPLAGILLAAGVIVNAEEG